MNNILSKSKYLVAVLSVALASSANAFEQTWTLEIDNNIDQYLDIETAQKRDLTIVKSQNVFNAINQDMADFVLNGKVIPPANGDIMSPSLINVQEAMQGNYIIYTGKSLNGSFSREYVGTWYDTNGQSGDFRLTQK